MSDRAKQIVCGLYLSKFDREGLTYMGFDTFSEAYNAFAFSISARPASIKNYRDEFDPYFQNDRKGWHGRKMRVHCREILEEYDSLSLKELAATIERFIDPSAELKRLPKVTKALNSHERWAQTSFAKRLVTGVAAERYFALTYRQMSEFSGLNLTDTTSWGCGFDFKLEDDDCSSFCVVEVKGLRNRSGSITITELEYNMADSLRDSYYVVLVRNFAEVPYHTIIQNPIQSDLRLIRIESKQIRVSWNATIGK